MVAPIEKDAESMPTQKIFKQRVRARMTKTGESYTAARHQLLRKATEPDATAEPTEPKPEAQLVADESMLRATGRRHQDWFALLDAWGATNHNHTEVARWLKETQGVAGWWAQNVTVAYERARGMRAAHEMRDGFSVSATRTVSAEAEVALTAFTDGDVRRRWLPDAPMRRRPTRAALAARFDWLDPESRVVVGVTPKGAGKVMVAVAHERLPDAQAGERLKQAWRGWLGDLKTYLEHDAKEAD